MGSLQLDISVSLVNHMGSDLSVVNAARVSFAMEHTEFDDKNDTKLINYLAKHNHWSPFGHASMQFHIKAPVFVARQLVKHQVGLVWNEVSRRYVDNEVEFYKPEDWRGRPKKSTQGSSDEVIDINLDQHILPYLRDQEHHTFIKLTKAEDNPQEII